MALPPVTAPGAAPPPPDLGAPGGPAPAPSAGGDWTPLAAILTNSQGQFKLIAGEAGGGAPGAGGGTDGQVFDSAAELVKAVEDKLGSDDEMEGEMKAGFDGGTDASPAKAMPPAAGV